MIKNEQKKKQIWRGDIIESEKIPLHGYLENQNEKNDGKKISGR